MLNANTNPETLSENQTLDAEAQDEAAAITTKKRISDTLAMGIVGGGLVTMAAAFLWRDLSLSPAHLITAGAAAGVASSMALNHRRTSGIGILGLFAATLAGGIWYAIERNALLLPALGIALLGALLNAALAYPRARKLLDKMRTGQIFSLLTLTTLTATTAGYFHFFTMGVESLGRRLVLTLVWSLLGVGMVVTGGKLSEQAMRYSGYAFIAAALAKVLAYDTTHLSGNLRVGVLALAGVMLLAGSLLNRRNEPQL